MCVASNCPSLGDSNERVQAMVLSHGEDVVMNEEGEFMRDRVLSAGCRVSGPGRCLDG